MNVKQSKVTTTDECREKSQSKKPTPSDECK